jgi:TolA-binding protein
MVKLKIPRKAIPITKMTATHHLRKRLEEGRHSLWQSGALSVLGDGIAVVVGVVLLVMLLFSNINEPTDQAQINELEQKIEQLEQRLEKYDGVDEKVTRIWEQAKSFETFKTRFDRSEASMSLRMDHLAMSLDALQKKTDETLKKVGNLEKGSAAPAAPDQPTTGQEGGDGQDPHGGCR